MIAPDPARLRELVHRQQIEEVMSRYAHGVDRHDLALMADVYHPDAYDWHGPFRGGVDDFLAWVNPLHEGKTRAHTHNITTHWSEVDGDRAVADTYVLFALFLRDRDVVMLGSGRYLDQLERRDGVWRIRDRMTLTDMRIEGDARCFHTAAGGYAVGQWDRSDLTYQRPLSIEGAVVATPVGRSGRPWGAETWQVLLDRRTIRDCIVQGLRGIDRGDRVLLRQCFQPGATIREGSETSAASDWCERRLAEPVAALSHHLTTHLATVDGDRAKAESYVIIMRRTAPETEVWTGGIRMLDRLERHDGAWRIAERTFVADWEFYSEDILLATDDGYPDGRRDGQDPWYLRR